MTVRSMLDKTLRELWSRLRNSPTPIIEQTFDNLREHLTKVLAKQLHSKKPKVREAAIRYIDNRVASLRLDAERLKLGAILFLREGGKDD